MKTVFDLWRDQLTHFLPERRHLAVVLGLGLAACGDDPGASDDDGAGDADGADDADGDGDAASERYLIQGSLFNTDGVLSYVAIVDDLEAGTRVRLDELFELSGSAAVAVRDDGTIYVGQSESPVLQRYRAGPRKAVDPRPSDGHGELRRTARVP